jgi:phosphoribosylanthranilate isomerase
MTLDIKICGLKTDAAIDVALSGGASHVGFIFFEKSPRHVSLDEAARLAARVGGKAKSVAVTVDADDATLDAIVSAMSPDMLQLHGDETPARVAEVKVRYGLPVMKAFSVSDAGDLDAIAPYRSMADRFLFDAKPPKGSDLPGGNGVSTASITCFPEASTLATSPMRCGWRTRPASTYRPVSKALRASRTRR